jgi:hypothetical protein
MSSFTPSKGGALLTYEAFKEHLSEKDWDALRALSERIGVAPISAALTSLDPTELRAFCQNALLDEFKIQLAAAKAQSPPPASRSLKLDTSLYKGTEGEAILRWFVEIETAMAARDIVDPERKVAYAMSRLAKRAKSWAYGKRLADPECFPNYQAFKRELRAAFEPPQTEFRTRSEFFNLSQGKYDILSYAQRARYLISCITQNPIDQHSQVVVFMKGLNEGPVRTELYRQYPASLEDAITLAMQEDFSLKQARYRVGGHPKAPGIPRKSAATSDPEPMDLSAVSTTPSKKKPFDKSTIICRRCWEKGHFPSECRAPAPVERPAHIPDPKGKRTRPSKNP